MLQCLQYGLKSMLQNLRLSQLSDITINLIYIQSEQKLLANLLSIDARKLNGFFEGYF